MKGRLALGLLLLLLGVGLPAFAVHRAGPPWAFKKRKAVVLEAVGVVELARPDGDVKKLAPGDGILLAEEVRVGGLSEVRLRVPSDARLRLGDGTRASFAPEGLLLQRGWIHVEARGAPVLVTAPPLEAEVELGEGRHRLLFDGRSRLELDPEEGRAKARVAGGGWVPGGEGKVLRIGRGEPPVWGAARGSLRCQARCRRVGVNAVVDGQAEVGSQVFVNGRPGFPDAEGELRVSLPLSRSESSVTLFGRDVSGNTCRVEARCEG